MSTTDTICAAFEAWALTCDGNCNDQDLRKYSSGHPNHVVDGIDYINQQVERDWQVWQAATEAAKATGTAGERPALTGNDVIEMIVGHLVSVVGGRNLMKGEEIGFSLDDLVFVANEAAARQPAPVADQLKLICAGFGWRTDGDSNVLADRIEHHIRDLKAGIKARDTVIAERDAALAATAAPVLSDEQCALKGGKCSCPTACQRNMQAWTTYWRGTAEPVEKQRPSHCPNCGANGDHLCPAGSLHRSQP